MYCFYYQVTNMVLIDDIGQENKTRVWYTSAAFKT